MGSSQVNRENISEANRSQNCLFNSRLIRCTQFQDKFQSLDSYRLFQIQKFQGLNHSEITIELTEQNLNESNGGYLTEETYFSDKNEMDIYLSNIIKLKQLCGVSIYDQLEIKCEKQPFLVVTKRKIKAHYQQIKPSQMKNNTLKFIDLLIFVTQNLMQTQNLYIQPYDIFESNQKFYLKRIKSKNISKRKLIMGYITWMLQYQSDFQTGIQNQHLSSSLADMDNYVREISQTLKKNKIDQKDYLIYFKKIKQKYIYLDGNFDSVHACFNAKKIKNNNDKKEWIIAKKHNEIYFVNIIDKHVCLTKLVRKKKKIDIQNCTLIFDHQELDIKFMLEGTKMLVKACEFELQDSFTMSDIEIKYKLPFKLKNPWMFLTKSGQIYFLQQMVFRYSPSENKLHQQSKKINDSIFIAPNEDHQYLVLRTSIDIFRNGIKIYFNDRYESLLPSGNKNLQNQIESIKIDLKYVEFCIEVYRGVYLMLAHKNFWILDCNFLCFFSFASLQRIKQYLKMSKNNDESSRYIFQMINQPFEVKFLHHHDGNNVLFEDDVLHILGTVSGKLYYLQYKIIFEAGILKLVKYKSLQSEEDMDKVIDTETISASHKTKQFYFNAYNQNLEFYKTAKWIYTAPIFLKVSDIHISTSKSYYQFFVYCEQVTHNLKEIIQSNQKINLKWSKFQVKLLIYKLYVLYEYLYKNQISHKNFNIFSIYLTKQKQMKLIGWSEPQRNWHISDYKDFLLTSFNIITSSTYDKLNDKIVEKHSSELKQYDQLKQKIIQASKNKIAEKRMQVEKNLLNIKQYLLHDISSQTMGFIQSNHIFSFQFNTPRFSLLSIGPNPKINKYSAIIQNNNNEQFLFKSTDKYVWNEEQKVLYIFTNSYQMYEAKINFSEAKEQSITLEEYEYLPKNIVQCSFIWNGEGLYSFGGIMKNRQRKLNYNYQIFRFSRQKLTWEAIGTLPAARINPKLIVSEDKRLIYLMGGELEVGSNCLRMISFDTGSRECFESIDLGFKNPLLSAQDKSAIKIFQLSQLYNVFLVCNLNNNTFHFKFFCSLACGFQINMEGKIYMEDSQDISSVSITFSEGALHFLRPYGKYTKIKIDNLEHLAVTHKTLYN